MIDDNIVRLLKIAGILALGFAVTVLGAAIVAVILAIRWAVA